MLLRVICSVRGHCESRERGLGMGMTKLFELGLLVLVLVLDKLSLLSKC